MGEKTPHQNNKGMNPGGSLIEEESPRPIPISKKEKVPRKVRPMGGT